MPRFHQLSLLAMAVVCSSCRSKSAGDEDRRPEQRVRGDEPAGTGTSPAEQGASEGTARPIAPPSPTEPDRSECHIPFFEEGEPKGSLCPSEIEARGLTLIDLSDDWRPRAFRGTATAAAPAYGSTFVDLANERFDGPAADYVTRDGYLELYGIPPSFGVLHRRLSERERHDCHAQVSNVELQKLERRMTELKAPEAAALVQKAARLRAALEQQRARKKLPSLDALAASERHYERRIQELEALEIRVGSVRAVQQHLLCDGLLGEGDVDGQYTWRTGNVLDIYKKRHFLIPTSRIDPALAQVMVLPSEELDFRSVLRSLRERVVDATGVIEDGTASGATGEILGRRLEPRSMRSIAGYEPLPEGAPDLVSRNTERAAQALGWTDAQGFRTFMAEHHQEGASMQVAVELPPPPSYHSPHMELRVEIDRGDVWYDWKPTARKAERLPALVLYAQDGDKSIPLVRWPTTIGGWKKEKLANGRVVQRWKESDVGARIWKELRVSPSWLPPDSTPDRELIRQTWGRGFKGRHELLGPSYRSAYGLLMFIHHRPYTKGEETRYGDNGIRTHGSSNLTSIATGSSHGCHRLFNHYALRLGSFVLAHRRHERQGELPAHYQRRIWAGRRIDLRVTSRGYGIELTPPIPIEVLPGRIRSARKRPHVPRREEGPAGAPSDAPASPAPLVAPTGG